MKGAPERFHDSAICDMWYIFSSCCNQDWHILWLEFLKLYLVHFLPLTDLFCSCLRCCCFHNSSTSGQLSTCWEAAETKDGLTEITGTPATSQRRVGRVTLAYNATSRLSHTLHTCTHLYTPVHTCTHHYALYTGPLALFISAPDTGPCVHTYLANCHL